MKRKLLALNLALAAAAVWAGMQLRTQYLAARAREAATLGRPIKPTPPPPAPALAETPPVVPADYAEIAHKMLFDKSRNPTVVVEVVVPPPPPPPPPVPPFPVLRGVMNLGDGLTAVFSEKSSTPPLEVRTGQRIGPFVLLSVNEQEAVFAWNGEKYRKRLDELRERVLTEAPAETSRPAPAAAAAPPAETALGPGAESGAGTRACRAGDSHPSGAVVDGWRKVIARTPFGNACRWEAVAR